jgi:small subunit ribosomal protein S20
LANKKSAIKRIRQNARRHERNNYFHARARTLVKKARASMDDGVTEDTRAAVTAAISALDKAAQKGILHPNNASRRKGRLMRRLAQLDK